MCVQLLCLNPYLNGCTSSIISSPSCHWALERTEQPLGCGQWRGPEGQQSLRRKEPAGLHPWAEEQGPAACNICLDSQRRKRCKAFLCALVIATYPTQTLGFNTIFQIYFLKMLFFNCSQCCLSIWTFSGYFSVLLDFWHSFRSNHHFTPVCHYIW